MCPEIQCTEEALDSTDDEQACQKCKDFDRFICLLKKKVKTASRKEKIKLLTLAPESMSQREIATTFGVTRHLVKKALELKKVKEILAEPTP